jgi:hypothetical protein
MVGYPVAFPAMIAPVMAVMVIIALPAVKVV